MNHDVSEHSARLHTETDAYLLLEELRWGSAGPQACPKCEAAGRQYFLNPRQGLSRRTRTGTQSARRIWKCGHCRRQYSVLIGTIFQGTRISLRIWLLVILELCTSKNPASAWQISRRYGITHEAAVHLVHRIEEAMRFDPVARLTGGTGRPDGTRVSGRRRAGSLCGESGIP